MADLVIGFDSRNAPAGARAWISAKEQIKAAAVDLERAVGKVGDTSKRTAKDQQDAGRKAADYVRQQKLVAQIMRDTGASHTVAAKAVRMFRGDLDKAEREAGQYARAMDRAENEVRQLAHAQRLAAGSSLTAAMGAQTKAASTLATAGAALVRQFSYLAGAAGVVALARGIRSVTDAYHAQAKAEAQVEQRLKSTGNVIGLTVNQLKTWAAEIQRNTGIGDEAIMEQQGVLLSFTRITRENFNDATKAAIDMATALGKDIPSQILAMGKALDDGEQGLTALRRSGTIFTDAQEELIKSLYATGQAAEAQRLVIAEVQKQYGGTAEAVRKAEGPTKALGAEFGDLLEKIGGLIDGPGGLRSFQEALLELLRDLNKPGALAGLETVIGGISSAIRGAVEVTKWWADAWQAVAAAIVVIKWPAIAAGINKVTLAMMANPFFTVAAGVAATVLAINEGIKAGARRSAEAIQEISAASDDLLQKWKKIDDSINSGSLPEMEKQLQDLTNEWASLNTRIATNRTEIERLGRSFQQQGGATQDQLAHLNELKLILGKDEAAAKQLVAMIENLTDATAENSKATDDNADAVSKAVEKYTDQKKALQDTLNIVKRFGVTTDIATEAQRLLSEGVAATAAEAVKLAQATAQLRTDLERLAAAETFRNALQAIRDAVEIAKEFTVSSTLAAEAQQLLADGVANTAEEALRLAKEARLLRLQLDQLADSSLVRIRITAEVETIDQDLPEYARQTLKPVRLISQMREVAVEEAQNIVDATSDMLGQLADAASRFDSSWAEMLSSVGRLVDAIGQLGNLGGGAGGGGGQGNAAASAAQAMSAVSTVIAVFTAIYDIYEGIQGSRKGKRFGDTVAIGGNNTSGVFRFGGEETFSATQGVDALGPQAWRALRQSIDEWRIAMGAVLTYMPELNIAIREDGEKVRLEIAGQVIGFFASAGEAAQAGIEIALQQSTFEGMGEAMRTALDNIQRIGAEAFLELIPVLRLVDDAAAGLTATQSAAKLAADQWAVSLDVMTEQLIDLGLAGEQVVAFRNREIAKMVEQTRQAGLNLAGINLGLDALERFQADVDAVNDAAQRSAASNQAYADAADTATAAIGGEIAGAGEGGAGSSGLTGAVHGLGIAAGEGKSALDDLGDSVAELPDQVGAGAAQIEQWFKDTVSAIFSLTAASGAFQQILDFQERYGVELVNSEALRRQIAEMEFMAAKLRIQLLAAELIANQELLGLTAAQLAMIQDAAEAIVGIEFPGVPSGGGGGRGASRRTAADNFRAEVERMERALSGATDGAIAYAQASDRLREQHRQGKLAAEELTYALSLLAEIQLSEIADDWRTASERLGQTDVEAAASALQRRASEALADALAAAADNPAAYEAARLAIEQGLEDQMRQIGFDVLAGLGSPLLALQRAGRDTIREIEYLISHLDELGLTAGQVAGVVRQSIVPSLLEMAASEAERVGDLERAERLRARQAEIERQLMIIQVRLWEAQLIAAGAMTDSIQTIIDNLLVDLATAADDAAMSIDALRASLAGLGALKDPNKTPPGPDDEEPTLPIWMTKKPPSPDVRGQGAGGAGSEGAPEEAGELLADIIEELRRNAEGPMERLASAHEDMLERIANATGTAAERLEAIALAEEKYARLRQEVLEDAWAGVKALIEDQMATGVLGGSPEERRQALTREVYSLAAQAAAGDLDAAQRLGERGSELLRLIESLYGGSAAGAGLAAPIIQLLQQAMAQAGLADPLGGLGQNIIPPGPGPTAGTGGAAGQQAQVVADLAAVVTALHDEAAASRAQHSALVQAHMRADTHNTNEILGALYSLAPDTRNVAPGAQGV